MTHLREITATDERHEVLEKLNATNELLTLILLVLALFIFLFVAWSQPFGF